MKELERDQGAADGSKLRYHINATNLANLDAGLVDRGPTVLPCPQRHQTLSDPGHIGRQRQGQLENYPLRTLSGPQRSRRGGRAPRRRTEFHRA